MYDTLYKLVLVNCLLEPVICKNVVFVKLDCVIVKLVRLTLPNKTSTWTLLRNVTFDKATWFIVTLRRRVLLNVELLNENLVIREFEKLPLSTKT